MKLRGWLAMTGWLICGLASGGEIQKIRLGVMAGGTLQWELAAIRNEGLLDGHGIELESITTANPQAGKVALQAGSVDVIISDWIWVSSMRADGGDLTFHPYTDVSGSLLVPNNSPINSLADLQGKKLGIAGGELDKNWLLLQALAQKQNLNLDSAAQKIYGAPPLLNQQLLGGDIDALLTYWHYAARLQPQGYRQLLSGEQLLQQLGIATSVPNMGYVFKAEWAKQHRTALLGFFKLAKQARDLLCNSDSAWQKILPLTETEDATVQTQLRRSYCEGRVEHWSATQQDGAEAIYQWLRKIGSNKLTGKAEHIVPGTFWSVD